MRTNAINIFFIILLFQIYNINLLKVAKQITTQNSIENSQDNQTTETNTTIPIPSQSTNINANSNCNPYLNSVDIKAIVAKTVKDSSASPSKYYFLFFFSKPQTVNLIIDNNTLFTQLNEFGTEITELFPNVINISFYCQSLDLKNYNPRTQVIGIYNGTIIENKKMGKLTYEYIQYIMKTFKLKPLLYNQVNKENNTMSSTKDKHMIFLQKCCGYDDDDNNDKEIIEEDKDIPIKPKKKNKRKAPTVRNLNEIKAQLLTKDDTVKTGENLTDRRISRLCWSLLIVVIVSLSIFFLVKYSIDWATSSKTEINKQNDQRLREIAEMLTAAKGSSSMEN